MADAWVFPGGAVDDADRHLEADPFAVAAIRETYEESGLLLAYPNGGSSFLTNSQMPPHAWRQHLDNGAVTVADLLDEFQLTPALNALSLMAHWITPPFETRRYDTRFFIAAAPQNQRHAHDEHEMSDSAWWSPRQTIERYRQSSIHLAPPTLRILERLLRFESVDDALDHLADAPPPAPIMPQLLEEADEPTLLLPGDDLPQGVTHLVRRGGQWFSEPSPGPENH